MRTDPATAAVRNATGGTGDGSNDTHKGEHRPRRRGRIDAIDLARDRLPKLSL